MRNRLVPKLMILIPGGDLGDKRIAAFGASENSAYRIFKKSCKCGNERLVSHFWCRKMKAGSCRSTDVTKRPIKKQRRDSQCNGIGLCRILSTGKTYVHLSRNPQGQKFGGITPEILFD